MLRKSAIRGILVLGVAASLIGGTVSLSQAAAASCGGGGPTGDAGVASRMGCPAAEEGKGCCGQGGGGNGYGAGKRMRGGPGGAHHENIHALLDRHEAIQREVKEVEGGVETVTTSEDPEIVEIIREHVREMQQRVESGHGLRWWDPTFAELFRNYDKIEMQIEDVPGGVRVLETSKDPDVAMLIRQHAIRGVSEFVAEGHARARKPTPLPEGYNTKEEDSRTGE